MRGEKRIRHTEHRRRSRGWSLKTGISPLHMNTSKTYLQFRPFEYALPIFLSEPCKKPMLYFITHQKIHVWSNSHGKQTEDWQKDSYNQSYKKKMYMEAGRKGRGAISSGLAPWEGTQKRRGIIWLQRSFLGSEQLQPYIRHPKPGVWHWEDKSP